jgi:Arc/MetJ-type ribon-helix-helix transcriptional regulator
MAKSITVKRKKPGRPATGTEPLYGVRISDKLMGRIQKWGTENYASRSEAIRRLVELGLKAHTPEPKAVEQLRERVAGAAELTAKAVDSLTVGAADADEKASRKRRLKAKGK